jgi:3-oxoacyl-[acyl-carrier protein] reductase
MNTETKTAIVTGATRGVGRAIALALAANGYELWITARSQDGLMALKAELEGISNIEHHFHALDFSDQNQVLSYTNILTVLVDKIDVLVNNAGIYIPDQLLDEESALEKHMQVNFYAAYTITQAMLPAFEEQKGGYIFNICSVVNKQPRAEAASYTISKFALYGYHQVLLKTLKPHQVKVTALLPSSINTSSWDGMDAPKDEFVQPEDIADVILAAIAMKPGTVMNEIELQSINPDF